MTSQRFELGWLIAWNLTSEWISSCLTPFVIYLVIIIQAWLTPCAAGAPAICNLCWTVKKSIKIMVHYHSYARGPLPATLTASLVTAVFFSEENPRVLLEEHA